MASSNISGSVDSNHYRITAAWSSSQNGENSENVHVVLTFYNDYSISIQNPKTGSVTIDGTPHNFTLSSYVNGGPGSVVLATVDQTVSYGGATTKSITISADFNWKTTIGGTYYSDITCSGTATLDTLAQTTPSTPTSLTINPTAALSGAALFVSWNCGSYGTSGSYSANFNYSELQMSQNGGAFSDLYSGASFSTSVAMPNIPGGYVTFRVRVYNDLNLCSGWAASSNISCLGASTFNGVTNFNADDATVSVPFNVNVYNGSFVHDVSLINSSGTTIASRSKISLSNGTNTLTLSSSERTALLNAMPNSTAQMVHLYIVTYNGSTNIGSATSTDFTASTAASNSAPSVAASTFQDSNSATVSITGNNQWLIQNLSTLQVSVPTATAKNSATISSYSVAIANSTVSQQSPGAFNMGTISQSGSLICTLTVTDSRGYTASYSAVVNVAGYTPLSITTGTSSCVRNGYGTTVTLTVNGVLSQVLINSVNKNSFSTLQYRYMPSGGSWSSWTSLSPTATSTTFSFTASSLSGDLGASGFTAGTSFTVQVKATDKVADAVGTNYTTAFTLSQAIPLMTFKNGMVGINNPSPANALDVTGNISASGNITIGGTLEPAGQLKIHPYNIQASTDLNTLITPGMYYCPSNATVATFTNCPTSNAFSLLVESHAGYKQTLTEYMTSSAKTWTRNYYNGTWGSWKRMWDDQSDGSGSGLDADTVDGHQPGNGGGLDADTVDSKHFSDILLAVYPIGSIYLSVSSTNPGSIFGGTWVAWGGGRVPLGVGSNGTTNYPTVETTGGVESASHNHYQTVSFDGGSFYAASTTQAEGTRVVSSVPRVLINGTNATGSVREDTTYSTTINLLQPYITCYMWKRTA